MLPEAPSRQTLIFLWSSCGTPARFPTQREILSMVPPSAGPGPKVSSVKAREPSYSGTTKPMGCALDGSGSGCGGG